MAQVTEVEYNGDTLDVSLSNGVNCSVELTNEMDIEEAQEALYMLIEQMNEDAITHD
jgi:hypothetical protein